MLAYKNKYNKNRFMSPLFISSEMIFHLSNANSAAVKFNFLASNANISSYSNKRAFSN